MVAYETRVSDPLIYSSSFDSMVTTKLDHPLQRSSEGLQMDQCTLQDGCTFGYENKSISRRICILESRMSRLPQKAKYFTFETCCTHYYEELKKDNYNLTNGKRVVDEIIVTEEQNSDGRNQVKASEREILAKAKVRPPFRTSLQIQTDLPPTTSFKVPSIKMNGRCHKLCHDSFKNEYFDRKYVGKTPTSPFIDGN